jgi:hypothetical protein
MKNIIKISIFSFVENWLLKKKIISSFVYKSVGFYYQLNKQNFIWISIILKGWRRKYHGVIKKNDLIKWSNLLQFGNIEINVYIYNDILQRVW